ncbi:MAG: hypothetical protein AB7M05_06540 [Alphaproteobacteria bacterium]
MPTTPAKTSAASRRIGPEDEDRQSQLDGGKRTVDNGGLKDIERRVRESAVDDADFSGAPRR